MKSYLVIRYDVDPAQQLASCDNMQDAAGVCNRAREENPDAKYRVAIVWS